MSIDYSSVLLKNIHESLLTPDKGETFLIKGDYEYWHYGCDGFNDRGWGCGYRTLQTICSWIRLNNNIVTPVPSIRSIQEILVRLEDKEKSFVGSKNWIGSIEVSIILDELFNVLSKILHVQRGGDLCKNVDKIKQHFIEFGSPLMMGGDQDCSSKGIVGIHYGANGIYLLIVDPHFVGRPKDVKMLQNNYWVKWQRLDEFIDSSFYNICLPQVKCKTQNT